MDIQFLDEDVAGGVDAANADSPTGFSFSRLDVPRRRGYAGRAIYLDADMLAFGDVAEIWTAEMAPEISVLHSDQPEGGARSALFAVTLFNCAHPAFRALSIPDSGKGGHLVHDFCHLPSESLKSGLPYTWNSLECYEPGRTRLLHYTIMPFQPWWHLSNPNGVLWYAELQDALRSGNIVDDVVREEVALGNLHPAVAKKVGLSNIHFEGGTLGWIPPIFRRDATIGPKAARDISGPKRLLRDYIILSPPFQRILRATNPARYRIYRR